MNLKAHYHFKQIVFISSILLLSIKSIAKIGTEPDYCLSISGKVLYTKKIIAKPVKVYLINCNTIIDSLTTSVNKVFSFQLKKNKEYSIKIIEPGLTSRLISISTYLPQKIKNHLLFQFHFDLLPFEATPILLPESDILDFPVALIYFNPQKGCFDYNKKYTTQIKASYKQITFQPKNN